MKLTRKQMRRRSSRKATRGRKGRKGTRARRGQRGGGQQVEKVWLLRAANGSIGNVVLSAGLTGATTATGTNQVTLNAIPAELAQLANVAVKGYTSGNTWMAAPPGNKLNGGSTSIIMEAGTKRVKLPTYTRPMLGTEAKLPLALSMLAAGLKFRNLDASQFGSLSGTGVANEVDGQMANICIELTFNVPGSVAASGAV